MKVSLFAWLGVAAAASTAVWERAFAAQPLPGVRDYATRDYYVAMAADPSEVRDRLEEPMPIPNYWLFSHHKGSVRRSVGAGVMYDAPLRTLHKRMPLPADSSACRATRAVKRDSLDEQAIMDEFGIEDPEFGKQWHIVNTEVPGHDMNIVGAWRLNATGSGVTVAIVDDGLDYTHPDFAYSFSKAGSWDYNDHENLPTPKNSDDQHGTRCAGEVAAGKNDVCGVGVAPNAKVAGIRILSGILSDADEARAMNHQIQVNDIFSCSWGPSDDGRTIEGPPLLVQRAILNGVENGRDGKGSIYVFASGNGFHKGDNCNYDGYTNSIYSITIAAIDEQNSHPYYAESCSANMAVTYSSNSIKKITTTNRESETNVEGCTDQHSGTSAAAPIAAGILALVLEVRPELTWRDMQYVVREAAEPFEIATASPEYNWTRVHDGKLYHNDYGYGLLDAEKVVDCAKRWELVGPQSWFFSEVNHADLPIREEQTVSSITVTQDDWDSHNLRQLEHVAVVVNVDHENRGVLQFSLESPSGFSNVLAEPRTQDTSTQGIHDWTFTSVFHWGESPVGEWKLKVSGSKFYNGTLVDWQLKLWGEAEDASEAVKFSTVWDDYKPHIDLLEGNQPAETLGFESVPPLEPTNTPESVPVSSELATPTPTDIPTDDASSASDSVSDKTGSPSPSVSDHHGHSALFYICIGVGIVTVIAAIVTMVIYLKLRSQGPKAMIDEGDFAPIPSDIELDDMDDTFGITDEELSDDNTVSTPLTPNRAP